MKALKLKKNRPGDKVFCKTCKDEFIAQWKGHTFCSRECQHDSTRKFNLTKLALKELLQEGKSLREIGLDLKVDKNIIRKYCILWELDYQTKEEHVVKSKKKKLNVSSTKPTAPIPTFIKPKTPVPYLLRAGDPGFSLKEYLASVF